MIDDIPVEEDYPRSAWDPDYGDDVRIIWKPDPEDISLLHSILHFDFGTAHTHCGKAFTVESAKSRLFGKMDRRCAKCERAR